MHLGDGGLQLISLLTFFWIVAACHDASAQPEGFNYDEDKVPSFDLPDPLVTQEGQSVQSAEQWMESQRPQLLQLMSEQMFGIAPNRPENLRWNLNSSSTDALGGLAHRHQITVYFTDDDQGPQMDLLIYSPSNATEAVPAFIGYNFFGNHSIQDDPEIEMNPRWMRNSSDKGVVDNQATEEARGKSSSRWPVEMIVERGFALVTIYYGDVDPDFDDGFQNGVHAAYADEGFAPPADDQWGSIATWAWGLSCALDCLEEVEVIDAEKVAVMGHSRLGKTSLWAGATDERFALVISNNSGCGGAALSRRRFGETVERINTSFPHWFCGNFKQYNGNEDAIPFDQHTLISLIAPRPVYVASAVEDRWADPRGEFLSALYASPVYQLLGTEGMAASELPELNESIQSIIGYHIRAGRHDVTDYDWEQYLDFAERHLSDD